MMVFVLRIDTKEGLRPKLKGESTSGVPRLNWEILLPPGEGEKNSRLKILIRAKSQL